MSDTNCMKPMNGETGQRTVIRGGTVLDGTGGEPYAADVEIVGGRIGRVGVVPGGDAVTIDATGKLVTPGFIDIHTHYDGQVTWSTQLAPSSAHGVTTAVLGNCGVGFAPCRPADRMRLVHLMEGVEDIPEIVFTHGLPWAWESFPDYLDFLASRRYDMDIGAYVPHAAVRVYAMGERGAARAEATAEDRAAMRKLVTEAARAGALGFATPRSVNHRSSDGAKTPMYEAGREEMLEIARGLGDAGTGLLQMAGLNDDEADFKLLADMVGISGRPAIFSLAQSHAKPRAWQGTLGKLDAARAAGVPIAAQVCGRSVGMLQGLDTSLHPFVFHPSYKAIADLPLAGRLARLRDPALRARLLAEKPEPTATADPRAFTRAVDLEVIYELGDPPNYEPRAEDSIAARARALGVAPEALAYDLLLKDEGRNLFLRPLHNYADHDFEAVRAMLVHPGTHVGLGDGGAHLGYICDAGLPTFMLTFWARDRARGDLLPLPQVVRTLTLDLATQIGLTDRGRIAPGLRADLNVIDYERLRLHRPHVVHDLPGGGRRLLQDASGYDLTMVAGVVTQRAGQPTGAWPGRLVRGGQPAVAH